MTKPNINFIEKKLNYRKGNQMEIRSQKNEKSNLIKLGEQR